MQDVIVEINGIEYEFSFHYPLSDKPQIRIAFRNDIGRYRTIINGKIDWDMENDPGRVRTSPEVRRVADKLVANKAFL